MIKGDPKTVERCRKATPNDKWCHVNFDAIDQLPEEFEAIITEVKFTDSDFSDVGNKTYMPKPELCYAIAEACGISGGDNSVNEPLVEEVDINRLRAELSSPPNMQKMVVGRLVRKYSSVLQEDGTERKSSVCSVAYNAFERCCELWSKEENDTQGYTVEIKNGAYKAYDKDQYGEHFYKGKFAYPVKYRTRWQRQAHIDSEMKFAGAKAETKANLKTIRELAGLMTGYKANDLLGGVLVFSRIRRSTAVLKMETAARLQALAQGHGAGNAQKLLFGISTGAALDEFRNANTVEETVVPDDVFPPPEPKKAEKINMRENLASTMSAYIASGAIHPDDMDSAIRIQTWAKASTAPAEESQFWTNVKQTLSDIEKKIPEEARIHHGIK
jgi:hypothetical protein